MTGFAHVSQGTDTWRGHCGIPRHRHAAAYAALVLSGGYEESKRVEKVRFRPLRMPKA
jgi:hypothetical protein